MQAFVVTLPSGQRYWTVVDERWLPVIPADRFLRFVRFGQDRAESTTKAYAGAVALFLTWCDHTGRAWHTAADDMASFVLWLRFTPKGAGEAVVRPGPGARPVRGERRINVILVAVRAFLLFAVSDGQVAGHVVAQLYDVADTRDLPSAARGEDRGPRQRLAARHRLKEPQRPVTRLADAEIVAMLEATRSARDKVILLLMARAGLRRGEVVGLRREDMHLLLDNAVLGCRIEGSHLHVVPRENSNGARAKSRRARQVPLDRLVVQALDLYAGERAACRAADDCDFLLVNLRREPLGAPMRPGRINELVGELGRRARVVGATPHRGRHAFGSNVIDAGGSLDEVQALLGHASPSSSQVYLHPDQQRLRDAVDRVHASRPDSELVRR